MTCLIQVAAFKIVFLGDGTASVYDLGSEGRPIREISSLHIFPAHNSSLTLLIRRTGVGNFCISSIVQLLLTDRVVMHDLLAKIPRAPSLILTGYLTFCSDSDWVSCGVIPSAGATAAVGI